MNVLADVAEVPVALDADDLLRQVAAYCSGLRLAVVCRVARTSLGNARARLTGLVSFFRRGFASSPMTTAPSAQISLHFLLPSRQLLRRILRQPRLRESFPLRRRTIQRRKLVLRRRGGR